MRNKHTWLQHKMYTLVIKTKPYLASLGKLNLFQVQKYALATTITTINELNLNIITFLIKYAAYLKLVVIGTTPKFATINYLPIYIGTGFFAHNVTKKYFKKTRVLIRRQIREVQKQAFKIVTVIVPIILINSIAIGWGHHTNAQTQNLWELYTPETYHQIEFEQVDREAILKKFLQKYNSPLAESADTFVEIADKYDLDYRLLPAISCMESTCGKKIAKGTYNPFGWGGGTIKFKSFDEAIEKVGKGVYEIYALKGMNTPEEMAPVYVPPMQSHWIKGVNYFLNQIDETAIELL